MSEAKKDESDLSGLLCVARTVELPDWATHVAVSTARKETAAEPCLWCDKASDYLDENPSDVPSGNWVGGYNHKYWVFFSRAQLNT